MSDFERTDLRSVISQIDSGCGFVVAGHNYGRVDRMSEEELDTIARGLGKVIEEAGRLLDAIGYTTFERLE